MLAGIGYSFYLGDHLIYHDEKQYYQIAKNLVENRIYSLDGKEITAWRPPGYPFFLSLFIQLGANIPMLRIANFIAFCLSIYMIASFLQNRSKLAGLLSACMLIAYPVLFYSAGTLYPQTVMATLLVALFVLLNKPKLQPILIGSICGALILLSPIYLFILALTCLWVVFSQLKHALIIGLTSIIVITPWTIRNIVLFQAPFFISTNSAINFFIGNNGNEVKNVTDIIKKTKNDTFFIENVATARTVQDLELMRDRLYREKAFEYIVNQPKATFKNYIDKFIHHFSYWNELSTEIEESNLKKFVLFTTYNTLLLIALIRILFIPRLPLQRYELMILLCYILFGAFQAIFFTRIRFRIPFDYLLILFNAAFIGGLLERMRVDLNVELHKNKEREH